jgi:phage repressor protein C with HTH and peptisase S24 domain
MEHGLDHVRQRLLDLSQERGVSLAGLSELVGRNPSYLQQFIRKGSPRRLAEDDRRKLAQFFAVPESELGGTAEATGAARSASEWVAIDRIDLEASAGPGALANDEAPFDTFRFSRRWLAEQGLERATLSAITVAGDSMEPLLNDGDEILVDRSLRPFRDGIHVVRLGDSLLVKRVASAGAGRFTLLSENAAYPPVEVKAEELEIIGRVVWKGGRV